MAKMIRARIISFLSFICCTLLFQAFPGVESSYPYPSTVNLTCSRCSKPVAVTKFMELGSSITYDPKLNCIHFVNQPLQTIYKWSVDTKKLSSVKYAGNEAVIMVLPIKNAFGYYLITYKDSMVIVYWNEESEYVQTVSTIYPAPAHKWPQFYLTHCLVTPNGALIFFSNPKSVRNPPPGQGRMYVLENGKTKFLLGGLTFVDGGAFSPDGRCFHFHDFNRNLTYKSRYDPYTNTISDVQLITNFTALGLGRPIAMTTDSKGYVWVSIKYLFKLLKLDPQSGEIVCSIDIPISIVTSITFGKCPGAYGRQRGYDCLYCATEGSKAANVDGPTYVIFNTGSSGFARDNYEVDYEHVFQTKQPYYY